MDETVMGGREEGMVVDVMVAGLEVKEEKSGKIAAVLRPWRMKSG
jgi:hypothetical protein